MNYTSLKYFENKKIGTITIDRLEVMNALNSLFFSELSNIVEKIDFEENIHVLIITGQGNTFAAGGDISEMRNLSKDEAFEISTKAQACLQSVRDLKIPVVAAINGYAFGGGCELAMACDFRIASSLAKFSFPEINLGLIPGGAGTQQLPRLVGLADAMYMLYTADRITAQDALRIGLVQKIIDERDFYKEIDILANNIASKSYNVIKKIKNILWKSQNHDFTTGCKFEAETFSSLLANEGKEGINAFFEKRDAKWQS